MEKKTREGTVEHCIPGMSGSDGNMEKEGCGKRDKLNSGNIVFEAFETSGHSALSGPGALGRDVYWYCSPRI